jgi:hypothetical protein
MCDCKSRGWANRERTTTQLVFKSAVSHVGRACTRHQVAMKPFRVAVANITIMDSKIGIPCESITWYIGTGEISSGIIIDSPSCRKRSFISCASSSAALSPWRHCIDVVRRLVFAGERTMSFMDSRKRSLLLLLVIDLHSSTLSTSSGFQLRFPDHPFVCVHSSLGPFVNGTRSDAFPCAREGRHPDLL